eukprot:361211-Chlamydomonas_euryale.AAC.3
MGGSTALADAWLYRNGICTEAVQQRHPGRGRARSRMMVCHGTEGRSGRQVVKHADDAEGRSFTGTLAPASSCRARICHIGFHVCAHAHVQGGWRDVEGTVEMAALGCPTPFTPRPPVSAASMRAKRVHAHTRRAAGATSRARSR